MTDTSAPEPPAKRSAKPARHGPKQHCAICGEDAREPMVFGMIRPAVAKAMLADHPELTADSVICRKHLVAYRTQYVEDMLERERGELSDLERQVVESLAREETVSRNVDEAYDD